MTLKTVAHNHHLRRRVFLSSRNTHTSCIIIKLSWNSAEDVPIPQHGATSPNAAKSSDKTMAWAARRQLDRIFHWGFSEEGTLLTKGSPVGYSGGLTLGQASGHVEVAFRNLADLATTCTHTNVGAVLVFILAAVADPQRRPARQAENRNEAGSEVSQSSPQVSQPYVCPSGLLQILQSPKPAKRHEQHQICKTSRQPQRYKARRPTHKCSNLLEVTNVEVTVPKQSCYAITQVRNQLPCSAERLQPPPQNGGQGPNADLWV